MINRRKALIKRVEQLLPEPAPERHGHSVELLCMGQAYFPALLADIAAATHEVRLETYIFARDAAGEQFFEALKAAARRGVDVHLVLDGFGGREGVELYVPLLRKAGVRVRVFRPEGFVLKPNPRRLRRMHRKVAVIDRRIAYVGGINLIDDFNHDEEQAQAQSSALNAKRIPSHALGKLTELAEGHLGPRYDFAVRLQGPAVLDVWKATEWLWWQIGPGGMVTDTLTSAWWKRRAEQFRDVLAAAALMEPPPACGKARVQLVLRDNFRFRRTIERRYLQAIGQAHTSVVLANAYFVPGRRFRMALIKAAERGVKVQLLLQGRVEHRFQHHATQGLYSGLLRHGVEIFEYQPSFLHAKVAVVDSSWATVGSSNIDPLSFLFAREANLLIHDPHFAATLKANLTHAIANDARKVMMDIHAARPWQARALAWVCYKLMRLAVFVGGFSNRY